MELSIWFTCPVKLQFHLFSKGIRADKRKYIDGLAEAAEQAARAGGI